MNEKTKGIIGLVVVVVLVAIGLFFILRQKDAGQTGQVSTKDYKNISYVIDGTRVQLKDGYAETEAAPDSATKIVTKYFGNEVKKDLNGDGREDVAFLLTQDTGGSGTFFYVVAAIATKDGYTGTNGVLLGDRIAPQTTESGPERSIVVNYQERAPGEAMTDEPSVGKSMWLVLDPKTMELEEVAEADLEEESESAEVTLTMQPWKWISAERNDGEVIIPKKDVFILTFKDDGTFGASTDCNSIGGNYSTTGSTLAFSHMAITEMYCEGSQDVEFNELLRDVNKYSFSSKDELVLNMKKGGSMYFRQEKTAQ